MTEAARAGRSYALLADGTTMTIRPSAPGDYQAVLRLHEAMSQDNLYFRFFSASRVSAEREARRVCLDDHPGLAALLGLRGDDLVGVASYELTGDPAAAEIALAVADDMHRHGVATLLLEHLVSLARARGVKTLVADVLPDNYPVLHVLADAGLIVRRRIGGGVIEISMPIPDNAALGEASTYLDAVADREKRADVASLAPLLAPRSVAVVGAGRRPGSLGRTVLLGIRDGGFPGALYAVSPHGGDIEGIRCVPSVADLPEAPDLAVVAVPPASVVAVARECGRRGVRALAVITSGLTPEQESGLLAAARQGSMRLLGPASFGVAVPGIGLDAALAVRCPSPGKTGIAVQSGGVGAALAEQLSRLGIGISSFASVGDMLDVSGADMLLWWGADESTELAVLYLESFGNARRFARTARRASAMLPILTVHAGRSAPGQRAAASHTAAAVAPLITRQALFDQAGIIATTSFGELLDAVALVASQPIPAGGTVAVVSNGGGAAVLTADACAEAGLTVAATSPATRSRLREVLPAGSALGGPVNATAAVGAEAFGAAIQIAAESADAVIAVVVRGGRPDLIPAIIAARLPVPVAAVVLDQPEAVRLLPGDEPGDPVEGAVPAYAYPEAAARALARAARYGSWWARPPSTVPEFGDLRERGRAFGRRLLPRPDARGRLAVRGRGRRPAALLRHPDGGVHPGRRRRRRGRRGGPPGRPRGDQGGRARPAAQERGRRGRARPERGRPGTRRGPPPAGRVRRAAVRRPGRAHGRRRRGDHRRRGAGTGVRPGRGVRAGRGRHRRARRPHGSAGPPHRRRRRRPVHSIRAAAACPALDGLRDILLRVSRLADDLPQVAELDLNPVIARPDGVIAVDARVRVTSRRPADPFLRQLPQ